jgi:hypothetical protein
VPNVTRRGGLVKRLAVPVAILVCIALGASPAAATHLTNTGSPGGPTVPWGFNEFWGFNELNGVWNPGQSDFEIALANAIMPRGQSAHRLFVQWRRVEYTEDLYEHEPASWAVTDRAYQAMQGAEPERKPVMVIHDAPDWARDPDATCRVQGCTFPPDPDHYADWQQFVQDAVTRYPNVRAIEVWNEPNLPRFWGPAPDPASYVEVLARAKDAVASTGIPVITGALSPVRTTSGETPPLRISSRVFLREIYELGDKNDFEGIGTHPFTMSKRLFEDMWIELNRLFEVRDNHNDPGTPLWITEISVSSDAAEGVGPSRQGKELVRLYHSIEGHEIESFIIFRFHDAADGTPYSPYFKRTGVVELNLAPKPAYCWLGAEIGTPCGKVAP